MEERIDFEVMVYSIHMGEKILMVTTEQVAGREIAQVLGLVRGNTIHTRHVGSDIVASFRSLIGGEIKGYVKAFNTAREEATLRMLSEAQALGANAVIGMRYSTSQVAGGGAEILAYGTAVKLR